MEMQVPDDLIHGLEKNKEGGQTDRGKEERKLIQKKYRKEKMVYSLKG
jgi:hypothetical protein